MVSEEVFGIFLSFLVLIVVTMLSMLGRPTPSQNESLLKLALQFFYEGDFPTAIIDTDLQVCFANKIFSQRFLQGQTNGSIEPLLAQEPFSNCKEACQYILNYKATGLLPEQPVFFGITPMFKGDKLVIPSNYFVIRRIFTGEKASKPRLGVSLVGTGLFYSALEELTQSIAQKESNLQELQELDRLKSEFLATLSHELKTPLVSITGYLDLIASQKMGPLTEKQEKALKISLRNTSHLNNMISSILNFARMEAGKLRFDLVNQKIQSSINDIVDSLKPMADKYNISFQLLVESGLPSVVIDTDLIHRVLSNLLENSIKFSQPGSTVFIRANQVSDAQIKVEIEDQGCGIPADKLGKIKAPFFQADKSDTRPTGGLGLGLAIAEKILIGHGTTLSIVSEEGKGTTCSFLLKIAAQKPTAETTG
jgi:signal transduction histidine kinase